MALGNALLINKKDTVSALHIKYQLKVENQRKWGQLLHYGKIITDHFRKEFVHWNLTSFLTYF